MRDPLKNYIDQHRTDLDVAVPSEELWSNIEKAMIVAIPAAGISSGIPWLKYFVYGLSSVAGAAVVYTAVNTSSPASAETKQVPVPSQTVIVSEPVAANTFTAPQVTPDAFVFANAATELPPPAGVPPTTDLIAPVYSDTLPQESTRVNALAPALAGDSVFTGIKRVEIVSTSATVIVTGVNTNELSVDHKETEGVTVELEYKRSDTLLQVVVNVEGNEKKSFSNKKKCMSVTVCKTGDAEVDVNVPAGVSVVVRNSYGDTKVSNISGTLCEVRSSSGNVNLAAVKAATSVHTSYGDLDARDITGNLTVRMSSGSAVVKAVTGNVDIASTYGDQVLTGITGNLKINGSSGEISVTNLRGDITANSTYGDIHISDFKGAARLVSSNGNISGDQVELTANSTFATTYGDVNMTLINPLQALSFDLATTYGDILIDKNGEQFRNESSLNLKRGDILIKATTSSGDQVFR